MKDREYSKIINLKKLKYWRGIGEREKVFHPEFHVKKNILLEKKEKREKKKGRKEGGRGGGGERPTDKLMAVAGEGDYIICTAERLKAWGRNPVSRMSEEENARP